MNDDFFNSQIVWNMARKSPAAIKEICDAGLNKLYCGMESGSGKVLSMNPDFVHKKLDSG